MIKPTLVYYHEPCGSWWPLNEGPICPLIDHDQDSPPRKGRKRKMWISEEDEMAFKTREALEEWEGLGAP